MSFFEQVQQAADHIREWTDLRPRTAVILGSGLGELTECIQDAEIIPYREIPGFPVSHVPGHAARLVFGRIGDRELVVMQGRFHYYEGFSMRELCLPVYVLRRLGVRDLLVTNACGAVNAAFSPGDLMLISDHINLTGLNPLIGPNDERFGPRFPDMSEAYDPALRAFARETAESLEIPLREGVYAFFAGPCYETAAEIRAYKALGADAVGMSTVPEVLAARHLGMRVLGLSCITNMATGIAVTKHSHEEVLATAAASAARFCDLCDALLRDWPEEDPGAPALPEP